jgi:hypothetical protein
MGWESGMKMGETHRLLVLKSKERDRDRNRDRVKWNGLDRDR